MKPTVWKKTKLKFFFVDALPGWRAAGKKKNEQTFQPVAQEVVEQ